MAMWNPWRGCHKYSEGCRFCYIHKGDAKRGVDTNVVTKADNFCAPVERYKRGDKKGEYKMKSGETVYLCFSSDFLLPDADQWRSDCWRMMRERPDLNFLFLTKRIERFVDCVPDDWGDGYENVTVGCTVENQAEAYRRLPLFDTLPIVHKNVILQPMLEKMNSALTVSLCIGIPPPLKNVIFTSCNRHCIIKLIKARNKYSSPN